MDARQTDRGASRPTEADQLACHARLAEVGAAVRRLVYLLQRYDRIRNTWFRAGFEGRATAVGGVLHVADDDVICVDQEGLGARSRDEDRFLLARVQHLLRLLDRLALDRDRLLRVVRESGDRDLIRAYPEVEAFAASVPGLLDALGLEREGPAGLAKRDEDLPIAIDPGVVAGLDDFSDGLIDLWSDENPAGGSLHEQWHEAWMPREDGPDRTGVAGETALRIKANLEGVRGEWGEFLLRPQPHAPNGGGGLNGADLSTRGLDLRAPSSTAHAPSGPDMRHVGCFGVAVDERRRLVHRNGFEGPADLSREPLIWHLFHRLDWRRGTPTSIPDLERAWGDAELDQVGLTDGARRNAIHRLRRHLKTIGLAVAHDEQRNYMLAATSGSESVGMGTSLPPGLTYQI